MAINNVTDVQNITNVSKNSSTKKSTSNSNSVSFDSYTKKKYTYFSRIDENVMHEVENGSPNSLRKAASMLRKTEKDYRGIYKKISKSIACNRFD